MADKPGSEKPETTTVVDPKTVKDLDKLSPEQRDQMLKDTPPPEGYNKGQSPLEVAEKEEEEEKPKEEKPKEEKPKEEAEPGGEKPKEEKPKEEKPKEEGTPPEEDSFEKLERELAKPEGQEDLTGFSKREQAYFHQMRRDRRNRQKAEEERDGALFELSKVKKGEGNEEQPKTTKTRKERLAEALKGKDEGDFVSVKDLQKILEEDEPAPAEKPKAADKSQVDPMSVRYLRMCEREARANHPEDFDSVMELQDELINTDPAQLRVVSDAVLRGDNVAEVIYQQVKKHPDFEKLHPAAEVRVKARKGKTADEKPKEEKPKKPAESPEDRAKREQAEKDQAALENNSKRKPSTARLGGAGDRPAGELTLEQIAAMPEREFRKLPRETRQRFLEQYGR